MPQASSPPTPPPASPPPVSGHSSWHGVDALTRDGVVVRIRTLRREDAGALNVLHAAVGEDNLRLRFFSPSRYAATEYAEHLMDFEAGVLCLVASVEGRLVGVASAEPVDDATMEVAMLMADDQHGRGLGSLLLEHLADAARERGARRFVADVLEDNHAMHRVFRDAGYLVSARTSDGVATFRIDLAPSAAFLRAEDEREADSEQLSLRGLLHPESVVVLGARRDGSGVGAALVRSIVDGGFSGTVHVVHPAGGEVAGRQALRSCRELPVPADLAVVAVPASRVLEALADVADGGVHAAVVVSSGFREMGVDGARLQRRMTAYARAHSIRLVGPNCLGVLTRNADSVMNATFADLRPPAGTVAVASQSGGVGIVLLEAASRVGLGVGTFVSLGNKADVSGNDLLAAWRGDPSVSSVCLYLESFGNGHKFARVARSFARAKPLLAVVGGLSEGGSRAGASHTAAAASNAVAVRALLHHAGVIACRGASDMTTTALLLEQQPLPAGRRLGIVSNAGGMGVLAADAAAGVGLEVPPLSSGLGERLRDALSGSAGWSNPVDIGAGATAGQLADAVRLMAASGEVDSLLVVVVVTTTIDIEDVLVQLAGVGESRDPAIPATLVVLGYGSSPTPTVTGFTLMPDHEDAVLAIARSTTRSEWLRAPDPEPAPVDLSRQDAARSRLGTVAAADEAGRWLTFPEGAALLRGYGLELAGELVRGPAAAAETARRLGLPVALKLATAGLHKTEQGAVAVDLRSAATVHDVVTGWGRRAGHAVEVLVQPMATGVEVAVGLVRDPQVGTLVMVAAGGVDVDVWDDRAFLVGPVTAADVESALRGLKLWRRLQGHRGSRPVSVASLVAVITAVSQLGEEVPEIAELDLNPVIVSPDGVALVDTRIRVSPGVEPRYGPALGGDVDDLEVASAFDVRREASAPQ